MVQLYQNYDKVIVNLVNNFTPNITVSLDLDEIKSTQCCFWIDFLSVLNCELQHCSSHTKQILQFWTLNNVFTRMLVGQDTKSVTPVDPNGFIGLSYLNVGPRMVVSSKEGIDYNLFHESCLVTVKRNDPFDRILDEKILWMMVQKVPRFA